MSKKAFLVGVNTQDLKYCESDAGLMSECLERYGYDITRPQAQEERHEILKAFEQVIKNCQLEDTVIVYFSGHSKVENDGLDFVLKDGDIITLNSEIEGKLSNRCKARNKLLILDCCNAGKAIELKRKLSTVENRLFPTARNYLILTASEFLENAKESDKLKAGFLTSKIHEALTYHPIEICPKDDQIQVRLLFEWLSTETKRYNAICSLKGEEVPLPHLFIDDLKVDFCIGVVGEIQKLHKRIEKLENRIRELEKWETELSFTPKSDDDFEQMAQVRKKAVEILSIIETQEYLIRDSMIVIQANYPNLTNSQRGLLEQNITQTLNWLIDSFGNDSGFVSEVEINDSDQALLLQEPLFLALEHIKVTGIPSRTSEASVVEKIRDYLDILKSKLTSSLV